METRFIATGFSSHTAEQDMGTVCNLEAIRCERSFRRSTVESSPLQTASALWALSLKAQLFWVEYSLAQARFHAKLLRLDL